jgi:hypothetical protein
MAAHVVKVRKGMLVSANVAATYAFLLSFIRYHTELESAAATQRKRLIRPWTVSSLLVIARVVLFLETNFVNHGQRRFQGELLDIPCVIRISYLVANVNFTIRLQQLSCIAKEPLHKLPMQARIRAKG